MDGHRALLLGSASCQVTRVVLMTVVWDPGAVMRGCTSFTASKKEETGRGEIILYLKRGCEVLLTLSSYPCGCACWLTSKLQIGLFLKLYV